MGAKDHNRLSTGRYLQLLVCLTIHGEPKSFQQLFFPVGVNQASAACTVLVDDVCSPGNSTFPRALPLRTGISALRATTSACPSSPLATAWKWSYARERLP